MSAIMHILRRKVRRRPKQTYQTGRSAILRVPETTDDLRHLYDKIYRAGSNVVHRVKGRLGKYGTHTNRDGMFLDAIARFLPPNSQTVLDASCGRGHLLRELIRLGYDARGTEIVEWLLGEDLKGFPVDILAYDELRKLGENRFDAVISNDVIEHMVDEDAARVGVTNLCYVSRKYVLISFGRGASRKYPVAMKLDVDRLHFVVEEVDWWLDLFKEHMKVVFSQGRFVVGEV